MPSIDVVVRSMLFGVLAGILAGVIAAWTAIRPTTNEQIRDQLLLTTEPRWRTLSDVTPADGWIATNPILFGMVVALAVAAASALLLHRRAPANP